jgi:hypothetical protein
MEWVLAGVVLWMIYALREAMRKLVRNALRNALRKVRRLLRELAWFVLAVTLPEGARLIERHEDGAVRIVSKPARRGRARQ